MTEAEKLAALSDAATQGVWEIELDQYDKPFPGICPQGSPFDMASFTMGEDADENLANAQLTVALVNAYRANQLVLIGPDAVEVVARALEKSLAFDVESDVYAGELTHEERCKLARAALAALTGRV